MKINIFLISLILACSSFHQKEEKKQSLFRTDGYYVYDNNSDSFHVVPNSEQDFIESVQQLKEMGLPVNTDRKFNTCAPDSVVFLSGSPYIQYITFLHPQLAYRAVTICRDSLNTSKSLEILQKVRSEGIDPEDLPWALSHFEYFEHNTAIFYYAKGLSYFEEKYEVKVSDNRDTLFVNNYRTGFTELDNPNRERVYIFKEF